MRAVDDYLIGHHDPVTNLLDGTGYLSNLGVRIYDDQTGIDPMSPDTVKISYPVSLALHPTVGADA
jgi:hypothetical protein